ncbi:MAG: hypothetical protein ABSF23_03215 [Terracidiphilus sp.]
MRNAIVAAARDGFEAVEFMFPYEHPAATLAALLKEHGLRQVLFNSPAGDWKAGERGLTAVPGRGHAGGTRMVREMEDRRALEFSTAAVLVLQFGLP